MRRLPIYILIDTSGSMRGEPIEAVRVGLDALATSLRRDPFALETVWLSVITYDREAKVVVPLTELGDFTVPILSTPETSPTNLGEGLELLFSRYRLEVKRSTSTEKGDWLPMLVIMTDGAPSDTLLFKQNVAMLKSYKFARIICCAAGPKAKVEPLKQIPDAAIYSLDTLDSSSFSKFWSWVSASVGAQSQRSSDSLGELPPPPDEIQLVF
ncbi:MAG: VWA domain-containing protein [Thermoguttaceae bacterium]|nr:VWA domain-containing protein [Thermoguttaceae bacterium]